MATEPKRTTDFRALKASGFIRQREKDYFVARLRVPGGVIDADRMIRAAELAKKFGRGYCHFTFQQSIEIPYVRMEALDDFQAEMEAAGLRLANCGPRVRAISACQGCNINPYGTVDALGLAQRGDERFFGLPCPAKFKICYSGCSIGCPNPQENDLGFHGMVEPRLVPELCNGCTLCVQLCKSRAGEALRMDEGTNLPVRDISRCTYCGECIYCCPTQAFVPARVGHALWVGGKHGRFPRWSDRVADFVSDEDTFELIDRSIRWYNDNAKRGERFGTCLDRVGLDKYRAEVLGNRWTTVQRWNRHGNRPYGVRYRVLHSWDLDGSEAE